MPSKSAFKSRIRYKINDEFMINDIASVAPELPTDIFSASMGESLRERVLAAINRVSSNRKEVLNSFIRSQPWRTGEAGLVPFAPLEFSFAFVPREDLLLYYGDGKVGKTWTLAEPWRLFVLFNLVDALLMQVKSWEGELHRDHVYHQFRVAWLCEKFFQTLMSDRIWDTLDSIVIDNYSEEAEKILAGHGRGFGYKRRPALPRLNGRSLQAHIPQYKDKCFEWRQDDRHPALAAGLFHDIGIPIGMFPRFISEFLSPIVIRQELKLSTSKDVKPLLLFLAHDEMMGYWRALHTEYANRSGVCDWVKRGLFNKQSLDRLRHECHPRHLESVVDNPIIQKYFQDVVTGLPGRARAFEVFYSFVGSFPPSSEAASIDFQLLEKLEEAVNNRDHGVLSALNLADYLLPSSTRAIAFHNDDSIDIWFAKFPVAFLLVLADELQEWQRPWMRSDGRYTYALDAVELQLSHKKATAASLVQPLSIEVKMNYKERAGELEHTPFDFSRLYAGKCKNLGRLISLVHSNDEPFPRLKITMKSPKGQEFVISTCGKCGRQVPSHEIIREGDRTTTRRQVECPYCGENFCSL